MILLAVNASKLLPAVQHEHTPLPLRAVSMSSLLSAIITPVKPLFLHALNAPALCMMNGPMTPLLCAAVNGLPAMKRTLHLLHLASVAAVLVCYPVDWGVLCMQTPVVPVIAATRTRMKMRSNI